MTADPKTAHSTALSIKAVGHSPQTPWACKACAHRATNFDGDWLCAVTGTDTLCSQARELGSPCGPNADLRHVRPARNPQQTLELA
ncbi:MAG: hypothetical protein ACRCV9_16275 [Burkholderiaceae bacterium]